MTFLELANRLLSEADISGAGLITTANQQGEYKQAIDYINTAYADIQLQHANWDFLRGDVSFNTISGVNNYSETAISLTDLSEWSPETMRIYLTANGIITEQYLIPVGWDEFRDLFMFGNARIQTGFPTHFTVKPADNSLTFYPIPDNVYTAEGEYYKNPSVLVNDTDQPIFQTRFHMIVVWRALMYFATQLNAQELYVIGNIEYRKLLFKLEQFACPAATSPEELA
jgi:hypothetical protein